MGATPSRKSHSRSGNQKQRTRRSKSALNEEKTMEKDLALLKCKNVRDRIVQTKRRVEAEGQVLDNKIRELVRSGDRDKAKFILKIKLGKKKLIEYLENQQLVMEQQIDAVEQAYITSETMNIMKDCNKILQDFNEKYSIEKVEAIMDERAELNERVNDIAQAIGGSRNVIDEDELEDDLANLLASDSNQANNENVPRQRESKTSSQRQKVLVTS